MPLLPPSSHANSLLKFRKQLLLLEERYYQLWKTMLTFNKLSIELQQLKTTFHKFTLKHIATKPTKPDALPLSATTKLMNEFNAFEQKMTDNASQLHIIKDLRTQNATQKQAHLAEMINKQKYWENNCQKEKHHLQEDIFQQLLKIVDLFVLSLQFQPQHPETVNFLTGMKMTYELFQSFLNSFGIKPMKTQIGQSYNYHHHHAIATVWQAAKPLNTIIEVKQTGYWFGEQPLRLAQVIINQKPPKTPPNQASQKNNPNEKKET